MELKWLEDFVSLAATSSFSRSAEERHVTQSAFSRRIKQLEAWLGVPLVDRATFPARLTKAGESFLPVARDTVRHMLDSRDRLREGARPEGEHAVLRRAQHPLRRLLPALAADRHRPLRRDRRAIER